MLSRKSKTWIYGLSTILWIAGCSFWKYFGGHTYYVSTAQVIFVAALMIHKNSKIIYEWLSAFVFFVAGNNLADELLFTPWEINITEYVTATIAIIYYLIKYVPTIKHTTRIWLKKLNTILSNRM